jgi:hypothetical protein
VSWSAPWPDRIWAIEGATGLGRLLAQQLLDYAAHKRLEIRDWLVTNPRVQVHFTPTSGSWLT